jgi:regulatory protein
MAPRTPPEPITDPRTARDRALKMLERRPYPRAELERALKRKGVVPEVVQDVVTRLVEAGLVNDATFARTLARSHLVGRGSSVRRVQLELAKRGVGRHVADDALAEVRADEGLESEEASVERAARKKLKGLAGLDPLTRARRLTGYLARRGFPGDLIREVLRRIDREAAELGDG